MWLHKLSWRPCIWILAGSLLASIMSYALRPQPPFRFLRRHRPIRAGEHFNNYELSGEPTALSRTIESELSSLRFKRIIEKRWSKGRNVEYLSADELTQVFLVSEMDETRPWSIWIRSSRKRSKLSRMTREFLSMFTPAGRHGSSSLNSCIANMRQIEGAQITWAIENPGRTNEIPSDADLFGPQAYIRVKPQCPESGRYILGNTGEHPHCSVPWHELE